MYHTYVHCVAASSRLSGEVCVQGSVVGVTRVAPQLLLSLATAAAAKITVAHTFACVKLSHNQYKVTFFIYFYDPTHSAYVRRLEAPDPTHPVLAIKSGQPLSLYLSHSFTQREKFVGFVPCVHTECLLLYVQQIFSVARERTA